MSNSDLLTILREMELECEDFSVHHPIRRKARAAVAQAERLIAEHNEAQTVMGVALVRAQSDLIISRHSRDESNAMLDWILTGPHSDWNGQDYRPDKTAPPVQERGPINVDYHLTRQQADVLKGAALLPVEFRRQILGHFAADHGKGELIEMFAQFIGMANSVVANSRDFLELAGIIHGDLHPYDAEKLNMPTIFGALNGIAVATKPVKEMCSGCAFRLGTAANQSPCTTLDAFDSASGAIPDKFMCHESMDQYGQCKTPCRGRIAYQQQALAEPEGGAK